MTDELTEARERLARDLELQDGGGVAYTSQDAVYTVVVQGEDLRTLLAALDQRDAEVERLKGKVHSMEHTIQQNYQIGGALLKARMRERARAQAAEQRLKAVTEALEPFSKLAAETLTPGSPDYQGWLAEAKDWTVIFSFGGHSITLGDLRRVAQAQGEAQG